MDRSLSFVLMIVLGIVIIETIGQYFLKRYQKEAKAYFLFVGCICFVTMAYLISQGLHFNKLIIVNMMWAAVSSIVLTVMAWMFFGEKITLTQIMGICVILGGMFLLNGS